MPRSNTRTPRCKSFSWGKQTHSTLSGQLLRDIIKNWGTRLEVGIEKLLYWWGQKDSWKQWQDTIHDTTRCSTGHQLSNWKNVLQKWSLVISSKEKPLRYTSALFNLTFIYCICMWLISTASHFSVLTGKKKTHWLTIQQKLKHMPTAFHYKYITIIKYWEMCWNHCP